MKRIAWSITILTAVLSGCSQGLTRDVAAHILKSAQFAKPKTARIQTGALGKCDQGTGTARDGWNALLSAGWIRLQDESSGGLIPIAMCNVSVTPAGQRHLQHGSFGSNEFLETVVARPGNIIVNGISAESKEAVVEFSYQMLLTEEGKVLVAPYATRNARALMRLYDDGWRVVSITKPSVDEMEEAFEETGSLWGDTQFRDVPWNPAWGRTANSDDSKEPTVGKNIDTANRTLQVDPNRIRELASQAHKYRTAGSQGGPEMQQNLQQAEQYGLEGMQALQNMQKPEGMSNADFARLHNETGAIFEGAVGFAALQKNDYATAQRDLREAVSEESQPDIMDIYPLATADLGAKPMNPEGFWFIVKASQLAQGTGQAQILDYGRKKYIRYHGSEDGWSALVTQAQASQSVMPPAGFTVAAAP